MGLLGRTVIPAGHVGIVRRRRGAGDEIFRNVTPDWNRRGTQARVLQPKQVYWLDPLTYEVKVVPALSVPRNMIGLVRAREGRPQSADARVGRHVECRSFEDGEAFLQEGGEQGVQVDTLRGDHTYYINTDLFDVKFVPRTHVPDGTIGLVSAKIGKVRPADRPFAKHVECDNFQDSARFIENGGQQGRQLAVLPGGTFYDVNTALFDVITADSAGSYGSGLTSGLTREHLQVISIPIGYVGVVVTLDGASSRQSGGSGWAEPPIDGHQSFQQPWTFLERGGRRGVQEEILRPGGLFAINPWFARVVLIPTRTLVLEWTERAHPTPGNFDAALEPIIINVQGHRIFMELSQTLSISEDAAPRLVSQFAPDKAQGGIGGLVDDPVPVQRFVERILGGTVAGYFNQIGGGEEALSFVSNLASIQADLASQVRAALSEWGVKAEGTILGKFRADDPMLDAKLKEMFLVQAEQRKTLLEAAGKLEFLDSQLEIAEKEDKIAEIQTNAEKRRQLLTPQLLELEMRLNMLGPDLVGLTDIVREISHANVPQFIGGSDAAAFLATLPQSMLPSIIRQVDELLNRRAYPGGLAAGQQRPAVSGPDGGEADDAANG
jgi:hypothetical protein